MINDSVNHPAHYRQNKNNIECIQVTENMNFCKGNAIKYIWRAEYKGKEIEDLEKAIWYLKREIERVAKNHTYIGYLEDEIDPFEIT